MTARVWDITLTLAQEKMTMSAAISARREFMIFDCMSSVDGEKVTSIWRILALAKVQILTEPKQEWGRIMGPVEV